MLWGFVVTLSFLSEVWSKHHLLMSSSFGFAFFLQKTVRVSNAELAVWFQQNSVHRQIFFARDCQPKEYPNYRRFLLMRFSVLAENVEPFLLLHPACFMSAPTTAVLKTRILLH